MNINTKTLELQKRLIKNPPKITPSDIAPLRHFEVYGARFYKPEGDLLIREGKVGCIVLAGGQGTRLGYSGPKGMFPIVPAENKTLFQFIVEKVPNHEVPLAIMTSPENHQQTVDYFTQHQFFGLNPDKIDFFLQTTLPILDDEGELIKDAFGEIMTGPDGNGAVFDAFISSGIQKKWQRMGIEVVNVIPVDNPLADPFDPELVGCLFQGSFDLVVKAIFREDPLEKVGVLVERNGRVHVIEYTELPESEKTAKDANGELLHRCANITLLSLKINVIKNLDLPLHLAHKAIATPANPKPLGPNAWKFEKFIFDIFPLIERIGVLVYPRNKCFAPLKNLTGPDSVETVQRALKDHSRGK